MLSGLMFWLTFGWTSTSAYSPRSPDRVSETDMQRLLHGVMEQLGIARPRVEYPAHQAMNLVGPQSIEGMYCAPHSEAAISVCEETLLPLSVFPFFLPYTAYAYIHPQENIGPVSALQEDWHPAQVFTDTEL